MDQTSKAQEKDFYGRGETSNAEALGVHQSS